MREDILRIVWWIKAWNGYTESGHPRTFVRRISADWVIADHVSAGDAATDADLIQADQVKLPLPVAM